MSDLYGITQKLENGTSPDELKNELMTCRCLGYSVDEDLVISKIDLSEDAVVSIIAQIAREEGLELLVRNQTENI